jgi:GH25 family lysozyme M1 (1,4-beta-N-acetylmuramidase)
LARFISVLRKEGDAPEVVVYAAPGWWKGKVKRTPSLGLQLPYCKAWIAHWDVGTPDPLDGLPGFVLHQYTDTGKVNGISTNVDRNYTNDLKELYR